jgi:exopolysaccharide biosynthesis WecB/TagA/CpsF family protein
MRHLGKKNILGILIDAINYEATEEKIFRAADDNKALTVSALAVHGVMTGVLNPQHKFRLNHFDLLVPDGQPVRWALNLMYGTKLADRVYGPKLTLKVCLRATSEGKSIYLYGSTEEVLHQLQESLKRRFPGIRIAGAEPSKFRQLTAAERAELVARVNTSGASLMLLGLGCPRQEVFAFEFRDELSMPILAVGAAFPFIAGIAPQAPEWMQARGFEWFFRLTSEPRRLWRRYLYLSPAYVALVLLQTLRIPFDTAGIAPTGEELFG